jgi:hypothetical protein
MEIRFLARESKALHGKYQQNFKEEQVLRQEAAAAAGG